MAYTGPAERITDLVPALIDESNFNVWDASLKWALDARDTAYYRLLTGSYIKPSAAEVVNPSPDMVEACESWEKTSRQVLPLLNATIHPTNKHYIVNVTDARSAYQILCETFGPESQYTRSYHSNFVSYSKFVKIRYTVAKPHDFVCEWRSALEELQASTPTKLSSIFVFYQFFIAASANPATCEWLTLDKLFTISEGFTATSLGPLFRTFLTFEQKRICTENQRKCWDPSPTGESSYQGRNDSNAYGWGNPTSSRAGEHTAKMDHQRNGSSNYQAGCPLTTPKCHRQGSDSSENRWDDHSTPRTGMDPNETNNHYDSSDTRWSDYSTPRNRTCGNRLDHDGSHNSFEDFPHPGSAPQYRWFPDDPSSKSSDMASSGEDEW